MKRVLVTGGNKGIGLAITKRFLRDNFNVVVVARDFLNFSLKNNNIKMVTFDLSQLNKIPQLVKKIGGIDILINNAGVMYSIPYDNYPDEKREQIIKLNIESPVALITHFSKYMIKKGEGRIVNISSIAGEIGHPDLWYGITKAGVINMTKSFARYLANKGIVVNAIAPGPVEGTDMFNTIPDSRKQLLRNNFYINRFAKPEEIADTAYWLATTSPAYINGFCIDINNGAFPR